MVIKQKKTISNEANLTELLKLISSLEESSFVRTTAVNSLRHFSEPAVIEALSSLLKTNDFCLFGAVVNSLGFIGGQEVLASLSEVEKKFEGKFIQQIRFSQNLIKHRHQLSSKTFKMPWCWNFICSCSAKRRDLKVRNANSDEMEKSLLIASRHNLGIEGDTKLSFQMATKNKSFIFNFDNTLAQSELALKKLKKNGIIGFMTTHSLLNCASSEPELGGIIFSSKSIGCRPTWKLFFYDLLGELRMAGKMRIKRGQFYFSLRGVKNKGTIGMSIKGKIIDAGVDIQSANIAASSFESRVLNKPLVDY